MKHIHILGALVVGISLIGAGCTSSNTVDGSVWQTSDGGATWDQMVALPQSTGVSSIANINVLSFEIDPSDDSAYYMGTQQNGLLYSLDYGQTWERPEAELARQGAIRDIEVEENDRCSVYALKSAQLIKTEDCSRTYEVLYTEGRSDTILTSFAIDWFNEGSLWIGTSEGEVLHSIDAGKSWTTVERTKDRITDILVSNHDSRIVLVGTEDDGLFRTTDGGSTWEEMGTELNRTYRNSDTVYSFTQDRRAERMLMATRYGLLSSIDQGETWQEIAIIAPARDQHIWAMGMNPENIQEIYYTVPGTLYMSQNSGQSWEASKMPSVRYPTSLRVHPNAPERIMIGFATLED